MTAVTQAHCLVATHQPRTMQEDSFVQMVFVVRLRQVVIRIGRVHSHGKSFKILIYEKNIQMVFIVVQENTEANPKQNTSTTETYSKSVIGFDDNIFV